MALDDNDKKFINEAIGTAVQAAAEASDKKIGELAGTVKTVTDTLENTIDERVKKHAEAAPKPAGDKDTKKDKPATGDEPEWFRKHRETQEALLKPVLEFTAAKQGEEKKAAERAAAKALITKTLTEKKLGGLLKNEQVLERLVSTGPKDAEAVLAAVEAERKFAASLGIKPESFGADAEAEGGTSPDGSKATLGQKKQATAEAIKKAKEADQAWR